MGVVSCTPEVPEAIPAAAGKVRVSFGVEGPGVKGYVLGEGEAVESLDLLVFRRNGGMPETMERAVSSSEISADVTEGTELDWYIVANAPEGALAGFRNEENFLTSLTRLEHTRPSTMAMHASGRGVFNKEAHKVQAALERYACKVSLEKIRIDWPEALPCRLERVLLLNAVGTIPWSGTPDAGGLWYNKGVVDGSLAGNVREMLVWESGADIDSPEAIDINVDLYTMPNPVTASTFGMPWSPRCTRMAIEITSGGISNWYTVDMPAMEGNSHYLIKNALIKGPGTAAPDEMLQRETIDLVITLHPWGTEENELDFGS